MTVVQALLKSIGDALLIALPLGFYLRWYLRRQVRRAVIFHLASRHGRNIIELVRQTQADAGSSVSLTLEGVLPTTSLSEASTQTPPGEPAHPWEFVRRMINPESLRSWAQQYARQTGQGDDAARTIEEEIARLVGFARQPGPESEVVFRYQNTEDFLNGVIVQRLDDNTFRLTLVNETNNESVDVGVRPSALRKIGEGLIAAAKTVNPEPEPSPPRLSIWERLRQR